MMRYLLDTNVVLDVLLNREPWVAEVRELWQANDGRITGYVTASAITDVFYVARRLAGLETTHSAVRVCLEAFEVCPVDRQTLEQAIALPGSDFEDNLQIACAEVSGLNAIITRNVSDFEAATVPLLTPPQAVTRLR